jgi:sec-independent protein translocase protein TatA
MFEGLSLTHILLFLVILLLLFGAKRLPEIGGALGKSIGEFKRSMRDVQNEFNTAANQPGRMEPPPPQAPPTAPPSQAPSRDPKSMN